MKIVKKYQTKNDCYRTYAGQNITPYGIMVHDIACNCEDAMVFVNGWNRSGISKGVHAFVDDEGVYECLPCSKGNTIKGWHCAGWLNWKYPYISFEQCESKHINWYKPYACKTTNQSKMDEYMLKVYANAVEYTARKCIEFGWNPLGKNSLGYYYILGHREANAINDNLASGHSDPESVWKICSHDKTMDAFRKNVDKKVKELKGVKPTVVVNPSKPNTPSNNKTVDVTYAVKVGGKVLPAVKNFEDFAGIKNKPIQGLAIKVSSGKVKYRVHVIGGGWLPYVTGYNWNDANNGWAGNGKSIDAIQVIIDGKNEAKYHVSVVNDDSYYSYQYDNNTDAGQDGYAGCFGKAIDQVMIACKIK